MNRCSTLAAAQVVQGAVGGLVAAWLVAACGDAPTSTPPEQAPAKAPPRDDRPTQACPTEPVQSPEPTPGTREEHRQLETWLGTDRDEVLLDAADIGSLNREAALLDGGPRDPAKQQTGAAAATQAAIEARLEFMTTALRTGAYVEEQPGAFEDAKLETLHSSLVDHHRLVVRETPLRCIPLASGLFKPPADPDFDRNACASLHPGERVRVLRRGRSGRWLYVHAGHTVGWVDASGLSPRLSAEQVDTWDSGERVVPRLDHTRTREGFVMRLGVSFPLVETTDTGLSILVPSAEQGIVRHHVEPDDVHRKPLPLTRANVFKLVFNELDTPYGWGGRAGHRDCSRLLRDVFAQFGIELGRHSGVQAQQGRSIDISDLSETAKLRAIEAEAQRGVVLLYMPGHIMLYLGERGGQHFAISAISEWLEPCPDGNDTVHRIDRVAVTTLEIGRGTKRTAFIERLTRLAVFGEAREVSG